MKILLLLAITLVFSCKSVDEGSYLDVVGGIATEDFPGIMGMKIYDPQSSYDEVCTVTLVEDKIFLTAAHCLVKTPQFKFEIFTGTDIFSRSKKGKMLEIEEYLIHPQFSLNNFQAGFDFALVKVTQSVGVPPIAFSTGKNRSFSELELVGFGFEGPYDRELSGIKRKVLLPVKRFDASHVVAGRYMKTSCKGDSGGPALIYKNGQALVVGVVSYGDCFRDSHINLLDSDQGFIVKGIQQLVQSSPRDPK